MFYSNQYIKISVKPHPQHNYVFTKAHIYLPYENLIPGHFIFPPFGDLLSLCYVELKSSNNNFQIPIFTANFLFPISNLQLYTTPNLNTNSSSNINLSHSSDEPCYNKFLKKHNFPLLPLLQTLKSFIQHLLKNSFSQLFKISINITTLETHVYLNTQDEILPNHIILSPNQYSIYYQSLNKSSTSNPLQNLHLNIATHNVRGFN